MKIAAETYLVAKRKAAMAIKVHPVSRLLIFSPFFL
jgi:hypothetical protein